MPDPIPCPECGHDIDEHRWDGCWYEEKVNFKGLDECDLSAADIARAYGERRFHEGWDACELRWAVGHSE